MGTKDKSSRAYSKFLNLKTGNHGPTYDPREIYQYLFDNSDRYGIIQYSQAELARAIEIQRETLNYYYQDFLELGFFEKLSFRTFRILVKPKDIEWNKELLERISALRKRHQARYRNENK